MGVSRRNVSPAALRQATHEQILQSIWITIYVPPYLRIMVS